MAGRDVAVLCIEGTTGDRHWDIRFPTAGASGEVARWDLYRKACGSPRTGAFEFSFEGVVPAHGWQPKTAELAHNLIAAAVQLSSRCPESRTRIDHRERQLSGGSTQSP